MTDASENGKHRTPLRERGTTCLDKTSWRLFLLQVVLVLWLAGSAAGTYLCYFSIVDSVDASAVMMQLFVQVAFGFGTVMTGVLYQSPAVFILMWGMASFVSSLLALVDSNVDTVTMLGACVKISAPCLLTASFLTLFSTTTTTASVMLDRFASHRTTCMVYTLTFLTTILGGLFLWGSDRKDVLSFTMMPCSILSLAVMILSWLYHTHRSHAHGSLLTVAARGGFVLTGVAMWVSIVLSLAHAGTGGLPLLLPQLTGSLLSVFVCAFFAAVTDVWYPVGTGQFHMVAVDTFCLLAYIVLPVVLLSFRFASRYGPAMHEAMLPLAKEWTSATWLDTAYNPFDVATIALLFSCAMSTMVGLVLVCNQCPLVGHLISWVYTHGQAQTRKVALAMDLRALIGNDDNDDDENNKKVLWKCLGDLAQQKVTLNIFVTLQDLEQHADKIKKLVSMGHYLGVCLPSEEESTSFPFWPSQWQLQSRAVHEVHEAFQKVTGEAPMWFHAGRGGGGSHPAALWTVPILGMQVAYWSTLLCVEEDEVLSDDARLELRHDLQLWGGGNLVFLETALQHPLTVSLLRDVLHVVKSSRPLLGGSEKQELLEVESLPLVVKDQQAMELPEE